MPSFSTKLYFFSFSEILSANLWGAQTSNTSSFSFVLNSSMKEMPYLFLISVKLWVLYIPFSSRSRHFRTSLGGLKSSSSSSSLKSSSVYFFGRLPCHMSCAGVLVNIH